MTDRLLVCSEVSQSDVAKSGSEAEYDLEIVLVNIYYDSTMISKLE